MVLRDVMIEQDPIDLAVHENMDKFVPDDMPEIPHRSVVRDDNAPLEEFKKPPDSLRHKSRGCIRLLEVEMRTVKDEGDAVGDIVGKFLLEHPVTFLGEKSPAFGEILHFRIVINIEVVGLEDTPIEFRVLDLISSKKEKLRQCRARKYRSEKAILNYSVCHDAVFIAKRFIRECRSPDDPVNEL